MVHEQARVLLVDDEETFRLSTATLLQRKGYHCDMAADGEQARSLLSDSYDALVSDLRMPGNEELNFLREVHEADPTLPIIVVTGYPSVDTAVTSLRLCCADYLLKPLELDDLLSALSRAITRRQAMRTVKDLLVESHHLAKTTTHADESLGSSSCVTNDTPLAWSLSAYVNQRLQRMEVLSTSLLKVADRIMGDQNQEPADICRFMECPRKSAYQRALTHTVEVLERTKHAFKSKDLGELRRSLEALLKESHH